MKTITFTNIFNLDFYPPIPAIKNVPEWYKKSSEYVSDEGKKIPESFVAVLNVLGRGLGADDDDADSWYGVWWCWSRCKNRGRVAYVVVAFRDGFVDDFLYEKVLDSADARLWVTGYGVAVDWCSLGTVLDLPQIRFGSKHCRSASVDPSSFTDFNRNSTV
jgi:hypothetical protein